jgi:hypothetical protein
MLEVSLERVEDLGPALAVAVDTFSAFSVWRHPSSEMDTSVRPPERLERHCYSGAVAGGGGHGVAVRGGAPIARAVERLDRLKSDLEG